MQTVFYCTRDGNDYVTKRRVDTPENIDAWLAKPKSRAFEVYCRLDGDVPSIPKKVYRYGNTNSGVSKYYVFGIDNNHGTPLCEIETDFIGQVLEQEHYSVRAKWQIIWGDLKVNPKAPKEVVEACINASKPFLDIKENI